MDQPNKNRYYFILSGEVHLKSDLLEHKKTPANKK